MYASAEAAAAAAAAAPCRRRFLPLAAAAASSAEEPDSPRVNAIAIILSFQLYCFKSNTEVRRGTLASGPQERSHYEKSVDHYFLAGLELAPCNDCQRD